MQQEQFFNQSCAPASPKFEPRLDVDVPQCCGTGCAVCVLDYPELVSANQTEYDLLDSSQMDSNMLALLEAVEQAQEQADKMFAHCDLQ